MQKTTVASAPDEVAALLKEAAARGHLVVLRTSPPPHVKAPLFMVLNQIFQLSPAESRVLVELMGHKQASREALHVAASRDGNAVSNIKIVDVIVCKMRKKLAPHGIEIVNIYGLGFQLAEGALEKIRELLTEYDPGLIPMIPTDTKPASDSAGTNEPE